MGKRRGRQRARQPNDRSIIEMENEKFEKYYKAQQILPEEEWDAFMQALRRPLPSTFRIAGNRQMKGVLSEAIKNTFVPELEAGSFEGEPLPVPRPITWYPEGLAWHLDVARKELRRSPEYKRFHSFLVYETENGNISRQEAVSMIPPLFLDVQPHHNVIDLCAAPGSKTAQLLEAMDPPTGILIANDTDHKRAHLLVHQTTRLPSPGLMVTNLDASIYPSLKIKDKGLRFDRILADVPCGGDGTIRKNIGIWKKWSPMEGNGLHSLQIRILMRAMRMLKADTSETKSRIVYSTCSLNPVENEAVIAAALNSVPGFELVDVSGTIPDLVRRPGLTNWRPSVNRDVDLSHASYEDYCASLERSGATTSREEEDADAEGVVEKDDGKTVKRPFRNRMKKTHWPPENSKELGLEKCLRIYPHLQDTGGFFVAVLQRKSRPEVKQKSEGKRVAEEETEETEQTNSAEATREPALKKARLAEDFEDKSGTATPIVNEVLTVNGGEPIAETGGLFKEDPYTFVRPDDPGLSACLEKLNLSETFPRSNIFVRNPEGTPNRSLYLVNDTVKSLMESTDYTKIRLVSAGVKIFGRSELGMGKQGAANKENPRIQFRVLSEGLLALLPYLNQEDLITGDPKTLKMLLENYYPLCSSFEEPFKSVLEKQNIGSFIGRFTAGNYGNTILNHDLYLPLWRSEVSASLMIDKKAKSALSMRLFGEDITVVGRELAAKQAAFTKPVPESQEPDEDTMSDNENDKNVEANNEKVD